MSRLQVLAIALFVILSPVGGIARAAGDGPWSLQDVMAALSEIKTIKSDFVEERDSALLTNPIEVKGTIVFKSPQTFIKEIRTPYPERVVVKGRGITIERLERKTDSVRYISANAHPAVKGFIESVRATMAGDGESLKQRYLIDIVGGAAGWKITLVPIEKALRDKIASITIDGHTNIISSIETLEADGDRSVLKLTYRKIEKK